MCVCVGVCVCLCVCLDGHSTLIVSHISIAYHIRTFKMGSGHALIPQSLFDMPHYSHNLPCAVESVVLSLSLHTFSLHARMHHPCKSSL